jgi:prepilin peptidase CpaA
MTMPSPILPASGLVWSGTQFAALGARLDAGSAYLLCACLCASVGAAWDLRTRRIPNLLTAPAFAAGLLLHLAVGGWHALLLSAAAGLSAGAVFLLFMIAGGMGAGDVKLMAAIGALAGFGHLFAIFVATALMGGIFALALALAKGRLKSTLGNVGTLIGHHGAMGLRPHPDLNLQQPATLRLPYGVAIAAGCWIVYLAPRVLGSQG